MDFQDIEWLAEIDFDMDDVLDMSPSDHLYQQACMEIEIVDLKMKMEKQAETIRLLEQRLANAETAILWCGESCYDEMCETQPDKYVKLQ